MNREIPIVDDFVVDRDFGTGAVKVTPAHDPNDFEIGRRHNLPEIDVMTDDAKMSAAAGKYAGLDRFAARKQIIADLDAGGFLDKVTDHTHAVGTCDRCGTIIEPRASTQWFVKMKPLAEPASPRWRTATSKLCRKIAAPNISSGCATFATGASPGNSGGPPHSRVVLRRLQGNHRRAARLLQGVRSAALAN